MLYPLCLTLVTPPCYILSYTPWHFALFVTLKIVTLFATFFVTHLDNVTFVTRLSHTLLHLKKVMHFLAVYTILNKCCCIFVTQWTCVTHLQDTLLHSLLHTFVAHASDTPLLHALLHNLFNVHFCFIVLFVCW